MDQAKNIKYLPLMLELEWKASDGSSTPAVKYRMSIVEEYSTRTVAMNGDLEMLVVYLMYR